MAAITEIQTISRFLAAADSTITPPSDILRDSARNTGGVAIGVRQIAGGVRYGLAGGVDIPSTRENTAAAAAAARGFIAVDTMPTARRAEDIDLGTVDGERWRATSGTGSWPVVRIMAVFLDGSHDPLPLDEAHIGLRTVTVKPYRINQNGIISMGEPITITDGTEGRDETNGRVTAYFVSDLSLDDATSVRIYLAPESGAYVG